MVGSNNGSYTLSSFNIVEFLPTFSEENETLVQSKKVRLFVLKCYENVIDRFITIIIPQ